MSKRYLYNCPQKQHKILQQLLITLRCVRRPNNPRESSGSQYRDILIGDFLLDLKYFIVTRVYVSTRQVAWSPKVDPADKMGLKSLQGTNMNNVSIGSAS